MAHDGKIVRSPWNSGATPAPQHPGGSERSDPSRPYPPLGRGDLLGAGANVKLDDPQFVSLRTGKPDDADFHHPHARRDLLGMHAGVKLDAGRDDAAFHHPGVRRDTVQGEARPSPTGLNTVKPR